MANRSRRQQNANRSETRPGQPPVTSFASRFTLADKVELRAMQIGWEESEPEPDPEPAPGPTSNAPALLSLDEVIAELTAALARERDEKRVLETELARVEEKLEAVREIAQLSPRMRLLTWCLIGLAAAVGVWVAIIIIF